nr:MAG TPA: tail-collar fiber protein [Caudoviricetes sp.]
MAKYPSISQTKNGRILIAKSNATGKALVPIKVVTGDGQLTNQNIETMENVINPLLELPFASPGRFVKEGQFQLDFALSNEHLEHGFYAREIGVFAKLDGEDNSTAVMIAYTNGGNFVDYIPAKDTPINSKVFEVTVAVDNAANVVVQRSDAAYITAGEMERHNADEHAHDKRFNSIIQQVNNMITSVDNSDSLAKAPTLQLVKTLLSSLNIKNATDVVNALESEKTTGLGIRYDFSNVNAWYICLGKLFGNLIIQGGRKLNLTIYDGRKYDVQFPISYAKECIGVLQTLEWPIAVGGASVAYTDKRTTTGYTIVADASSAAYNSDLFYVAFGI